MEIAIALFILLYYKRCSGHLPGKISFILKKIINIYFANLFLSIYIYNIIWKTTLQKHINK